MEGGSGTVACEIASARDSGCYNHFVVNDILETTVEQIKQIILNP